MIGKKIPNPKSSSSKAKRIGDLTEYIREPENEDKNEKCIYAGSRGFVTDEPHSQTAEMIALAESNVRTDDPIEHYMFSWPQGEQPTPEQIEQAVDIFLKHTGLEEHQIVYGLHSNTDNFHFHMAVNRVHPESGKCMKINGGYDIEAIHQVVALIEHEQGWKREPNGRYIVLENGKVSRAHTDPDKPKEPSQKAQKVENETGQKSEERIAIETAEPIIKKIQSGEIADWKQAHQEFSKVGMHYEKKGSGAIVTFEGRTWKASSLHRNGSLTNLEKTLGIFESSEIAPKTTPEQKQEVKQKQSEPIPTMPKALRPTWEEYRAERERYYKEKKSVELKIKTRHQDELTKLAKEQKTRTNEVLQERKGRYTGQGALLNAMRKGISTQMKAEKADIRKKQRAELEKFREQFPPMPDFEQWLKNRDMPEQATQYRYKHSYQPQEIIGKQYVTPQPQDIRAYKFEVVGDQIHYRRKDESMGGAGGVSFIDKGRSIEVCDWRNKESTLAALQLSKEKWGNFEVTGNAEYKKMCVQLAVEYNIDIVNLRDEIQKGKEKLAKQDHPAPTAKQVIEPDQLKEFERYSQAVNADRYRVTSLKINKDGSRQSFILDKKDGVTRGFTPKEIEQHTPEMLRLQERGENLYYTPLSENRHHILIDDMSRESLDRLIADGYQPAALIESSPGNYQAIITIEKLGTEHDRDIGNQLSKELNQEYGDPKLSGAVHPHRAPGYQNRKPNRQRKDGTFPSVRLVKAERRDCKKTHERSREINANLQRQTALKPQRQPRITTPRPATDQTYRGNYAYRKHHEHILRVQRGKDVTDLSRIDSMIAIRLRATGHTQADIEKIILNNAPNIRAIDEKRNWSDYAQRTAKYAFTPAADQEILKYARYKEQWVKLETPPAPPPEPKPAPDKTQPDKPTEQKESGVPKKEEPKLPRGGGLSL